MGEISKYKKHKKNNEIDLIRQRVNRVVKLNKSLRTQVNNLLITNNRLKIELLDLKRKQTFWYRLTHLF